MDELYNTCTYTSCVVDECNDVIIYDVYSHYNEEDINEMLFEHPEWSLRYMPVFI